MKNKIMLVVFAAGLTACNSSGGSDDDFGMPDMGNETPVIEDAKHYEPRYDTGMPAYSKSPSRGAPGSREQFETSEYYVNRALDAINAAARYMSGAAGKGVLLGMLDTGVDGDHPELSGALMDAYSYDYDNDTSVMTDDDGHGSHVAGIMIAERDGKGMHGVAPDADLAAFRLLGNLKSVTLDEAMEDSYYRLVDAGARAVNNSFILTHQDGDPIQVSNTSKAFLEASLPKYIHAAHVADENDLVSVWAAGNTDGGAPSALAALPHYFPELEDTWLSVVAIDENNELGPYSAVCGATASWCIAAPGSSIVSTNTGGGYVTRQGTSMATPVVTGSIALMASEFPELTGVEIVQILKDTATDLGAPGIDAVYGNGGLNLQEAIAPQGAIVIQTSDRIGKETRSIGESYIAGSGAVARALSAGLGGISMSVTDGYDRSYLMPMGASVAESSEGDGRRWRATQVASGDRMNGFADMSGRKVEIHGASDFSLAMTDGETNLDMVRLGWKPEAFAGALEIGGGYMSERDGFLGTELSGAYEADTRTAFIDLDWKLDVTEKSDLGISMSMGHADLSGSGVLRDSDGVMASTFGLSVDREISDNSAWSIGISSPLAIDSGKLAVHRPVGLGAAVNGKRSDKVIRESEEVSLSGADRDFDLEMGYRRTFSGNFGSGSLGIGAILDTANPENRHSVSASYTIRF